MENEKKFTPLREIIYTLLAYAVLYIISFFLLVLLVRLPLFSGISVLMYRGIILIVLASGMSVGLMFAFKKLKKISWLGVKDAVLVFILCGSINMVFFTLVPVTVERSVSVFMLSYMDTYEDKTYTEEEISKIFIDKYVYEYEAFRKRFDEQLATGSIEENPDGSYSITSKGKFIVKLFRTVSDLFETDPRLVYPENTGD